MITTKFFDIVVEFCLIMRYTTLRCRNIIENAFYFRCQCVKFQLNLSFVWGYSMFGKRKAKKEKPEGHQLGLWAICSEVWHWFYGAVILASLPLILTIVYEVRCGTNIELLGHRFFSDSLLATFALAACIYSASTGERSRFLCRDISITTMICSCAIYLAYYELETLFQWIPEEGAPANLKESIEWLTQLCKDHLESLFIACIACYAVNGGLGIWIAVRTKIDALNSQPVSVQPKEGGK